VPCPGRQTLAPVAAVPWVVVVIRATMAAPLAAMMAEVMLADMVRHSRAAVVIQAMDREVLVLVGLVMDMVLTLELDTGIMGLGDLEVSLLGMVHLMETQMLLVLVTKVVLQAQIEDPGAVKLHLLMVLEVTEVIRAMVRTLLVVVMHPLVRPLELLQAMGVRATGMVDMEMDRMLVMEDMGPMVLVMMVLEILELEAHLDMVQGMAVGAEILVILKVLDLVVRSMEVLKGSQIMVVAMAVCNLGLLSERQLECH
jgi:hypothetical protein